jgi:hypothetical protein
MAGNEKTINIEVNADLWRSVGVHALNTDKTKKQILAEALEFYLASDKPKASN